MENNANSKIGVLTCTTLLIGGMIGSAIFSLSGLTMYTAGPAAILSWIIGGVIMLIYGLLMAELSSVFPKSGGVYVFPSRAYGGKKGRLLGWLSCWGSILTNFVSVAFAAIYVGTYLSVSFEWAANLQIPLALISILFCVILNCLSFSTAGKINTVLVAFLVITIVIYVGTALFGGSYDASLLTPFFSQGAGGSFGFLSAVPTAIIGFSSIMAVAFIASEVKDAEKNVPKSMLIAITIVAVIYALIILATLGLITAQFLADNPGMQYIPLFAACFTKLTAVPWLSKVVSIAAVLALLTTMLVCVTMNSRALQAASDDGLLPSGLGKMNKAGVPAAAAVVTGVIGGIIACFPDLISIIVDFSVIFNVITIVLTIAAVIKARRSAHYPENAFRAPGGKVTPILAIVLLVLCNSVSIVTGTAMLWIYTIGFFAVGLVIFLIAEKNRKPEEDKCIDDVKSLA